MHHNEVSPPLSHPIKNSFGTFMASQGRPLPKFGEWDVNNPASAEGFTVIFNKARDEKKTKNSLAKVVSPRRTEPVLNKNAKNENYEHPPKRRWLCCVELIMH